MPAALPFAAHPAISDIAGSTPSWPVNPAGGDFLARGGNGRTDGQPAAYSGFQAGSLAHSFNPDSIVIDLSLGRGESIQITTNLRKIEAYTATLIIGLAGEDEAEPEKLKEFGFDDVFKKPFDVALLAERVQALAEAKRDN